MARQLCCEPSVFVNSSWSQKQLPTRYALS